MFGKGLGGQSVPNDADRHVPMWKKKSIFWELPYWKILDVQSAIDVMHLMKNLCVNLLNFLCVYGKTKDTLESPYAHTRQPKSREESWSRLASRQIREGDLFMKSSAVSRSRLASRQI